MRLHTMRTLWHRRKAAHYLSSVAVTAVLLLNPPFGWTQETPSLQQEINALKEGQQAIRKDLDEIKTLLRNMGRGGAPAAPQNVVLDLEQAQMKGEKTAKLVLVEFTDYQ